MNESFRACCDDMLRQTIVDMGIPHWTVRGSLEERLEQIVDIFAFPVVMPVQDAIERMRQDYAQIDVRLELERAGSVG